MPSRRFYANAAPQQTLASSITAGATSCVVAGSFSGWPVQFPFCAGLDVGTASFEIVSVTAIAGTTATVVRAQDGTSAISHPAGATLSQVFVRQDLDEANAHTSANTGVHGVSGSVVGTSDVQTLSNKTLTAPIANAPTITNPVSTGDATHPALIGRATTAGGKTLSLQNSGSTEKVGVDDAGNITAAGNVVATGNLTTAAGAVSGKTVAGAVVPTTFTNEAAATVALPSPATGTLIYLTAPTTTGAAAGPFLWNGTAWVQVTLGTKIAWTYKVAAPGNIGTSAFTKMSVTTLVVDRTNVGVTSGQFTVPAGAGGIYLLSGLGSFAANSTGRRVVALFLNGGAIDNTEGQIPASTNITQVPTATVAMPLSAGDIIDIRLFQDSGVTLAGGVCSITAVQL